MRQVNCTAGSDGAGRDPGPAGGRSITFVTEMTPTPRLYGKYSWPWHELAVGVQKLGHKVRVCAPVRLLRPAPLLRRLQSFGQPEAYSARMGPGILESLIGRPRDVGGVETLIADQGIHSRRIASLCECSGLIHFSSVRDFRCCRRILGRRIFEMDYILNPQRSCARFRDRMGEEWDAMFAHAASVVYPSNVTRDLLGVGTAEHSFVLVPYGIDPVWYDTPANRGRTDPGARLSLITACGLVPYKGVDRLLDAVADLPHVSLTVAGEGPYRRQLEKHAAAVCRPGQVRFAGWLSPRRMIAEFAAADAFILPSSSPTETLGLVFFEALARRLPIIGIKGYGVHGMFPGCGNASFVGADFGHAELGLALDELMATRPFQGCRCGRCTERHDRASVARAFSSVYARAMKEKEEETT